jgi:hypothetical protein
LTDLTIVPSNQSLPLFKSSTNLTPVVCDERAIAKLLEQVISKGGLSIGEASRRLGVTPNTIRQYLHGRRTKPSLFWFVKLCEICGAKVTVEFPSQR